MLAESLVLSDQVEHQRLVVLEVFLADSLSDQVSAVFVDLFCLDMDDVLKSIRLSLCLRLHLRAQRVHLVFESLRRDHQVQV